MAKVLRILAGPAARQRLAEQGLQPADVGLIPAAAGGPKGLVLNGLDRFLFGEWLMRSQQPVHLVGASIGAWRMATAARAHADADAAFRDMAEAYVTQRYDTPPGEKRPRPDHVSERFGDILTVWFAGRESEVLSHPRWRLHVVTSRGRHPLLRHEGRWRTPAGYAGAFASNLVHRTGLGHWLDRVVFSDGRSPLPLPLADFPTQRVELSATNLRPALLASCSIPFWLRAQQDVPGAPPGAYWDGGITDYHLHLDYRPLLATATPLVLYPHFQPHVVPGWLDKALKRRHRATPFLDNLVLLVPHPDWVASLPDGKLPDRNDFMRLDEATRQAHWRRAVLESARLAEAFDALTRQPSVQAEPLP
ncbi:patatin-like phospholipase family protein [Roseateles sp.]|uniref:patatin-like phospholipase family protein n=1 Tax=Roseateles sp. TaxID=1971397 RepID=UPI00395FAB6E